MKTVKNRVTKDDIYDALPVGFRINISDEFVDLYNAAITDTDEHLVDAWRENFVTFSSVLEGSRYTIKQYLNAVRYVSYKLMGYSNRESYKMVFRDRYDRIMDKYRDLGFDDQFIWDYKLSPSVVSYNKSQLVNKLMEQAMVPHYILNMSMYQEALNVQAHLMKNAKSEMVRTTAANSILGQLKPPETSMVQVDVTVKESDAIQDLRKVTMELAEQQKLAISSGVSNPRDIAETEILMEEEYREEYIDVEEN